MMIIGVGIDIIEIGRVARAMERHGQHFMEHLLTDREQEVLRQPHIQPERMAGRFAAKEAILKALGCGLSNLSWHEVEVVPDSLGAPHVTLSGRASSWAAARGITRVHLSISHSRDYAVAHAVAEGEGV